MLNPKFSIVFSVFGFVLSFLVALVSGAPFLIIILRAALSGVVFFVLSVLIHIVIEHFLPELIHPLVSSESDETVSSQVGGLVDVTVGGDSDVESFHQSDSFETTLPDVSKLEERDVSDTFHDKNSDFAPEETSPDGLGNLPDVESFAVSLKGNDFSEKTSDDKHADASGISSNEASSMARAIQTMLAHDN